MEFIYGDRWSLYSLCVKFQLPTVQKLIIKRYISSDFMHFPFENFEVRNIFNSSFWKYYFELKKNFYDLPFLGNHGYRNSEIDR